MSRWWLLGAVLAAPLLGLAVFVAAFEATCRGGTSAAAARYEAVWPEVTDRRPEAQSWLTYPEWHIVYSAESFAATLRETRPSQFAYARDIGGFWTSYCAVNRATSGMPDRTTYKVTIYTIGVSYTAELGLKAAYEWTIGRIFEWVAGSASEVDGFSANVQADYARFLHETPWYEYPFGDRLRELWRIEVRGDPVRHWERLLVLSAEYEAKALYGWALGAVVGATGHDERTLRLVARGAPEAVTAVDPRLEVVGEAGPGLVLVEAPRYEQFTELARALAASNLELVEIAGNDDIFVTALLPTGSASGIDLGERLFTLETGSHAGFERSGITVKVPQLLTLIRRFEERGGQLEHVYDY